MDTSEQQVSGKTDPLHELFSTPKNQSGKCYWSSELPHPSCLSGLCSSKLDQGNSGTLKCMLKKTGQVNMRAECINVILNFKIIKGIWTVCGSIIVWSLEHFQICIFYLVDIYIM